MTYGEKAVGLTFTGLVSWSQERESTGGVTFSLIDHAGFLQQAGDGEPWMLIKNFKPVDLWLKETSAERWVS